MRNLLIIGFLLLSLHGTCQKLMTLDQALSRVPRITNYHSDSLNKVVSSQIKSAWNTYIFQIQKARLLKEYSEMMNDLIRVSNLRYKAGDIDFFENESQIEKIVDIEQTLAISENELKMACIQLQQLLCSSEEMIPADSTFSLYEIDKGLSLYWEPVSEGDTGVVFNRKKNMEYKLLELDNIFIKIHYYKSFRLPYAETIMQTAFSRYQHEEIDYMELMQMVSESYKIRLDFLAIMNAYNLFAINLELYANE